MVQAAAELDRARTLAALDRTAAAEAAARSAGAHFAGKGHLPGTRRVAVFLAAHAGPAAMATTSTTREGS
ncbi:hypothetical protein LUR56_14220 [Streptomyces sp. MT29]|nr:hypothetical protein [Streptomyces sp. MT29]